MRTCLYCKQKKNDSEFSKEHIIPRAVGGAVNPLNPFTINDVCKRCNNLCGLFIDAPFIKSWFINNQRASNAKKFVRLTNSTVLPLTYIGIIEELKFDNRICEFWLGPTGDTIYHFHEPYPTEDYSSPIIGVPTTANLKDLSVDNGFTFLFIRSNNPEWHPTIVNSFLSNFKNSKLYLGNGPTPKGGAFSDIPTELKSLHDKLNSMRGKTHKNKVEFGMYSGERFLAKIALGIGSLIFDESFKESKSADLLRKFMWTKEVDKRHKIPIRGTGFLGHKKWNNLNEILKWEGGHTLALMSTNDSIALYTNFYEESSAVIQVSNEKEHWENKIDEGIFYVLVPGIQKAVGPLNIADLIGHKFTPAYNCEPLQMLESEMEQFDELPPFDI